MGGVMHRDIKPTNIMFKIPSNVSKDLSPLEIIKNSDLKLIDFGLSSTTTFAQSEVGNKIYGAPEVGNGIYGPKSDIYSVGAVLYELLTMKLFFPYKQTVNLGCDSDLSKLIMNMLSVDINTRP